jgi:hypothetical protein
VIQPQQNLQIKNNEVAPVTNGQEPIIPDKNVRTLGAIPPKRIMIEGHIYRLEIRAVA